MAWIIQHRSWVHTAVFALLVTAILGPWGYAHDGVPPAEWCRPPFLLLENGSCVGREPGTFFLLISLVGFPAGILQFLSGGFVLSELIWQSILALLFFLGLFFLPFLSTLLLARSRSNLGRRIFYGVAWGLAAALGLFVALSAEVFHPAHLWGIWLYILLALGLLAFGLLASSQSPSQPAALRYNNR
jgi:hypothetical protein